MNDSENELRSIISTSEKSEKNIFDNYFQNFGKNNQINNSFCEINSFFNNKERQNLNSISKNYEINDNSIQKNYENIFNNKNDFNDIASEIDINSNGEIVKSENWYDDSLNIESFLGKDNNYEEHDKIEEKDNNILGKKIERNKEDQNDNNNQKEKIFDIKKKCKYRLDYFKKAFIKDFLDYVLSVLNKLCINCKFCTKFGKANFHKPKRGKYAGNTKEEDNRKFIEKSVEEVFTDYKIEKNKNDIDEEDIEVNEDMKGIKNQKANELLINNIKKFKDNLANRIEKEKEKEKKEKYLNQFRNINILLNYLKKAIKDAMDEYYDSDKFIEFKSKKRNRDYDYYFYYERKRHFHLLEKNNFVRLVNLPYYSNKNKEK
jgi:hypothetical protein